MTASVIPSKSPKEAALVLLVAYGRVTFKLIVKTRLPSVLFTKNSICMLQISNKKKLSYMNSNRYSSDAGDDSKK